ncbi:MAG: hypothetical protein ACSHX5_02520 [Phycisphaerales bacterium]
MSFQHTDSTRNPESMTTEERLDEIASILAVGVYRAQHDTKTKPRGIDRTWRTAQNLQVSSPQSLDN